MAYYLRAEPDSKGRTYAVCPVCEDSRSDGKGHMVTYANGVSYCVRCGHTILGKKVLFDVPDMEDTSNKLFEKVDIEEGAFSDRHSALERYNATLKGVSFDAFETREVLGGETTGYLLRRKTPKKVSLKVGSGVLSHHRDLDISRNVVVVEGPYDVLTQQYISANGLIHKLPYETLSLLSVVLCPDGDIWHNTAQTQAMRKYVKNALWHNIDICAIIKLPGDKDPKDVQDIYEYAVSVREFLSERKRVML